MSLMIAATLALTAQTAECALEYDIDERRGGYPTAIRAVCPDDVADAEALQRAAEAAVAAIRLDPPREGTRRNPGPRFWLADSAALSQDPDGHWRPVPGQQIITRDPEFPLRAVERGADLAYCAVGLTPDASGSPQEIETGCLINTAGSAFARAMDREMSQAAAQWRLLPVDIRYCYSTEIETRAVVHRARLDQRGRPETSLHDPGPGLDPDDLPEFCAQAG
ncbi:hypothetical protein FKB34_00995 [Glycocaulis profundi]|nr:hypothetical protein FKB34_00995 [Glycocaulis profundi]